MCIRLNEDDAKAKMNLGLVLDKLGETEQAIKLMQEALVVNQEDKKLLMNLGVLKLKKGWINDSERWLDQAIELQDSTDYHSSSSEEEE